MTHRIIVFTVPLILFAVGGTNGQVFAQRETAPIIAEIDYFGRTTPEGQVKEQGPIERISMSMPKCIQTAANRRVGISGHSFNLNFNYFNYSPEYLSFFFHSVGGRQSRGVVNGNPHNELTVFYPILYTSDHYAAYAHGFFVFANLITDQRAIIRVELDMDLVYDDQASVTRIKGDSVWREPVGIGWSKVKIGLGELDPQYDLAPLVNPKTIEGRSKAPKTTPGEPPTHGITAVYESANIQADSGFYLASFPESILRKLEQAFNASISSPGIVYNSKASLSGESIRSPIITDGRGIHFRKDDQIPLESSFRVLMLGADAKEAYAVTTFFVTRPGTRRAAIVSAELNINLGEPDNPGVVHWSGPFIGDWQHICGFNYQTITDLILP